MCTNRSETNVSNIIKLISDLEIALEKKEKEIEKCNLKKITAEQLNLINADIKFLKNIFLDNIELPNDYYMESFALLFKCSDWEYNGDEEGEIFKLLAKIDTLLETFK